MITVEIIGGSGSTIVPITLDDDWARALRMRGYDPGEFNKIRWPTGATRWSTVKLLVNARSIFGLLNDQGALFNSAPVVLRYTLPGVPQPRPFELDRMWIRPPHFRNVHQGPDSTMVIELVDARYFWQHERFASAGGPDGFNVHLDDKSKTYESTESVDSPGEPFTFAEALERVIAQLGVDKGGEFDAQGPVDWGNLTLSKPRMEGDLGLSDMPIEGHPLGEIIDRLMIASGHVVVAFPSAAVGGGVHYEVQQVGDGGEFAKALVADSSGDMVAGGLWGPEAPLGAIPPPGHPMTRFVTAPATDLSQECPASVEVMFPTAQERVASYEFEEDVSDEALGYVMGRWHTVMESTGKPEHLVGNGQVVSLFDVLWARFMVDQAGVNTLINGGALALRASEVSTIYFERFKSGIGDMVFIGFVTGRVYYAGAGMVEWSLISHGPEEMQGLWTRVRGDLHDRVFGWRHDGPLSLTTGHVRSIPRPEGGVLLDAPVVRSVLYHPAIVDEVIPGAVNSTYVAHALDDPSIVVGATGVGVRPYDRPYAVDVIAMSPRAVGDHCFIAEFAGEAVPLELVLHEETGTTACPPPLAAAASIESSAHLQALVLGHANGIV